MARRSTGTTTPPFESQASGVMHQVIFSPAASTGALSETVGGFMWPRVGDLSVMATSRPSRFRRLRASPSSARCRPGLGVARYGGELPDVPLGDQVSRAAGAPDVVVGA